MKCISYTNVCKGGLYHGDGGADSFSFNTTVVSLVASRRTFFFPSPAVAFTDAYNDCVFFFFFYILASLAASPLRKLRTPPRKSC